MENPEVRRTDSRVRGEDSGVSRQDPGVGRGTGASVRGLGERLGICLTQGHTEVTYLAQLEEALQWGPHQARLCPQQRLPVLQLPRELQRPSSAFPARVHQACSGRGESRA